MKNYILTISIFFSALCAASQTIPKWKIGDLQNFIAKSDSILIVNFWATWCKPCVEEMPGVIRATKKYGPGKVKLLLVSLDMKKDYPTKIDSFIRANHISNKVVWLDETKADYFCPKIDLSWSGALPATLFYYGLTKHKKFIESALSEEQVAMEIKELLVPSSKIPEPVGYVNDFEEIFTSAQKDTLESIIQAHKNKTGDEIAIVTIENFSPYKNIQDFSLNLANSWAIGEAGKNNGVVIVFGSTIRQIRIQNGGGVITRLSDKATQKIIDENFIPFFKKNQYYNGAKSGLLRIVEVLENKSGK